MKHLPYNSPLSPNHNPTLFAATLKKEATFFFPKCISISKTTRRHNRQVLNQLFNLHIIQRMENKTNIISKQVCRISVDKKNQLDVTFCILYFSGWVRETNPSMDALPTNRTWPPSCSHGTYQHKAITSRSRQLLMMGTWLPETCWATIRREIKITKSDI